MIDKEVYQYFRNKNCSKFLRCISLEPETFNLNHVQKFCSIHSKKYIQRKESIIAKLQCIYFVPNSEAVCCLHVHLELLEKLQMS